MIVQATRQACKLALLCLGGCVVLVSTGDRFYLGARAQKSLPAAETSAAVEAIDEAPESDNATQRANRDEKNARYDSHGNGRDLTTLQPGESMHTIGCGPYDPTILPTGSHDVIVLGTLIKSQPYLSANRTAIYTEYLLDLEERLKTSQADLSIVEGLVIDRPGGVLRMRDGKIIASTVSGTGLARPLDVGRRYILFCRFIHDNRDLILGYAFELRDGKAYALWESSGYDRPVGELPNAVSELTEEQTFVQAVREAVKHPGSARYFSAPRN